MFDGANPKTPKTPAEIAAGVRSPAQLQACEAERRRLQRTSDELRRKQGELHASRTHANDGIDAVLVALDREQRELADRIGALRREVVPLRSERGRAVRAALAPMITATARRAHKAASELQDAIATVDLINDALERASSEPVWIGRVPGLSLVVERVAQLGGIARST
jgi:chromosome segregation ATPase